MMTSNGNTIVFAADPAHASSKRRQSLLARPPRVGDQLGEYRLCLEIGHGGMATVYLAQAAGRAGHHRFVALKCIRPELARNPKLVEMFLDEAQIASQIHHSNVCSVLDFDEHHGVYYLAMEYLAGQTLTSVHRQLQRSPDCCDAATHAGIVARMLESACEGLHAAHELRNAQGEPMNVVHRDVSPDNVFVTYDGNVKIVDFGVVYFTEQTHRTRTGMVKGKCSYLSPEVLAGEKPDRRTDIWGLGVVAWELLTRKRLFDQPNDAAILRAISDMEIPAPSTIQPGIPQLLDEIVLRALQRNPGKRYQTARELGRICNRFLVETRLVVGLADVAEFMQRIFPEGPACARQLLAVAEQLEESSDAPSAAEATSAERSDDDDEEGIAAVGFDPGTIVHSATIQKLARMRIRNDSGGGADERTARSHLHQWWRQSGVLLAIAGTSLLLVACSAVFAWTLRDPRPAVTAPEAAVIAAPAAVAASTPAAMGAASTPVPSTPVPALSGYALEAQPVGADDSGAILLRLRLVRDELP